MFVLILLIFMFVSFFIINSRPRCRERFENTPEDSIEFMKSIPKILFINLEHRTDRKKEFLSNFPHFKSDSSIERIDAILEPENGHIGCLKSHIKALKRAQEFDSLPFILICEDDFYIKDMKYAIESLHTFFESFADDDWDVLMLGINLISKKDTDVKGVIKVESAQTCSSYLIKINYIQTLLDIYEKDLETYLKTEKWSDWYCTDQSWKILQSKDEWFSFQPSVGIQRKSYSDIMKGVVNYNL